MGRDVLPGSLARGVEALAEKKGYRLVHTELSGVNAFFVRKDLAGDRFATAGEIPERGLPNYFQRGHRHPPADPSRPYLDLETGELTTGSKGDTCPEP